MGVVRSSDMAGCKLKMTSCALYKLVRSSDMATYELGMTIAALKKELRDSSLRYELKWLQMDEAKTSEMPSVELRLAGWMQLDL
jgi:hypothetical protein